jgi:hypothetical protein
MTDESLVQLLTEHLPSPPSTMADPPLAAIRRRARRRTGSQVALAGMVVAAIGAGAVVWASTDGTSAPATGGPGVTTSPTGTTESPAMLHPTYLPPGYREDPGAGSETELRFLNPDADPPIPLVIRRLPPGALIPAEGPALSSTTVRNSAAEALPIGNGGIALTWIEDGNRYSVSFEVPANMQVDFVIDQTVNELTAVGEGLRPRR